MLARLRREEMMKAGLLGFGDGGYPPPNRFSGLRSQFSAGPPSGSREAFLRQIAQTVNIVDDSQPLDSYGYPDSDRLSGGFGPPGPILPDRSAYGNTEHFGVGIRRQVPAPDPAQKKDDDWKGMMGLEDLAGKSNEAAGDSGSSKSSRYGRPPLLESSEGVPSTSKRSSRYGRPPLLDSGEGGPPPAKVSRYGRPPLIVEPYGAPPRNFDNDMEQGAYDDRVLNYVPPNPVVINVGAGRYGRGIADEGRRPNLGNWESHDFRRKAMLEDEDIDMQRNFSQHLISGFGWRGGLDLEGHLPIPESIKNLIKFPEPKLNALHPAYQEPEETIDGPEKFEEVIEYGVSLYIFDKSYETSLWDYDPKFTWDYIPGTKRGTRPQDLTGFLYGVNYTEEENTWRRWEKNSERVWKEKFVPKVKEQQIYIEAGLEPPEINLGKKKVDEPIQDKIMRYVDEHISLREDMCSDGYCGICDMTFQSVLPSVMHYGTQKHEKMVRNYFIDALWDHQQLKNESDMKTIWFQNLMNRIVKKFKTKPTSWRCTICDVDISSAAMATTHFKGNQHQRRAKGLPAVEKMHPDTKKQFEMRCAPCYVTFTDSREIEMHCSTEAHIANVYAAAQNHMSLPPGPSSRIGKTKMGKTNWKAQKTAQPPPTKQTNRFATQTGANTTPLGGPGGGEVDDSVRPDFSNLFCAVCSKAFLHPNQLEIHMTSNQHMKKESEMARRSIHGKQPVLAAQKKHIQLLQQAAIKTGGNFQPKPPPGRPGARHASSGQGPAKKQKVVNVPTKAAIASVFGPRQPAKKVPAVNLLQRKWVSGGVQSTSTSLPQNRPNQWRGY